jgi:hypothetical protein
MIRSRKSEKFWSDTGKADWLAEQITPLFLVSILTELMHYKYLMIIDIGVWFSNYIWINLLLFDLSQ